MVRILCTTSRNSKACAKKMLLLFIAFDILTLKSPPLKTSPSWGFLLFIISTVHWITSLEFFQPFLRHLKILLIQQYKRPYGLSYPWACNNDPLSGIQNASQKTQIIIIHLKLKIYILLFMCNYYLCLIALQPKN